MNWLIIILLALILFFNRYLFLEPRLPVRLPAFLQEMLHYSAPALLTAICVPIIILDGETTRGLLLNPYLLGSTCCILFAYFIRNMLLSVLLGMAVFFLLNYLISAS